MQPSYLSGSARLVSGRVAARPRVWGLVARALTCYAARRKWPLLIRSCREFASDASVALRSSRSSSEPRMQMRGRQPRIRQHARCFDQTWSGVQIWLQLPAVTF